MYSPKRTGKRTDRRAGGRDDRQTDSIVDFCFLSVCMPKICYIAKYDIAILTTAFENKCQTLICWREAIHTHTSLATINRLPKLPHSAASPMGIPHISLGQATLNIIIKDWIISHGCLIVVQSNI